jgi:hypothetical protein
VITLNFRLPVTGERVSRRFEKDSKIGELYNFIDYLTAIGDCSFELESQRGSVVGQQHKYLIVQAIGMKRMEYTDLMLTLEEAGLFPRAGMLII